MRPLVTSTGTLALVALALAPTASGWTPPRQLDPAAQAPIYTSDSHGRFYAFFARVRGKDYRLFFDRLGREGGRGQGERADRDGSAPGGGDYALAMSPSGRAIALWCSAATSTSSPGVFAALRAPGGRFGTPHELAPRISSSGTGDTCSVTAAAGSKGGFVAVWRRTGSPGNRLEAATVAPGSGSFSAAQRLDSRATGRRFPTEAAVDARGRATVAWLARGRVFAARQDGVGSTFDVAPTPGGACDFGARPIRLASAEGGASVLLSGRCVGRGRHVLRMSRAKAGRAFGHTQRIGRTPYAESRLVANGEGDVLVTWRNGSGQLLASTGNTRRGIRHDQRLTPRGRAHYREGIDSHSSAISGTGRAVVAWRQRSLRPHATIRIRLSNAQGRFARHVTVFKAPGATGVDAAMNLHGDAGVAWNRPRRGGQSVDQLVAVTRMRGRLFELPPQVVVRGSVEPVGLLASSSSLLLTWVTQPGLKAVSSVGRFRGR
jgi:hypothetical protein